MTVLLKTLLSMSLAGTALAVLLAALRPLLRARTTRGFQASLWLLVVLRLLLPVTLGLGVLPGIFRDARASEPARTTATVVSPSGTERAIGEKQRVVPPGASVSEKLPAGTVILPPAAPSAAATATGSAGLPTVPSAAVDGFSGTPAVLTTGWWTLPRVLTAVWAAGMLLSLLTLLSGYRRFMRALRLSARPAPAEEQAVLALLTDKPPELLHSAVCVTPMLAGIRRPVIWLPEQDYGARLEYVLRHELAHLRRRDIPRKWLTAAACAVHWFNPAMPLLRRELARACELACDEAVIREMDGAERIVYGETLLAAATDVRHPVGIVSATMCEEKRTMRERIAAIGGHRARTRAMTALACLTVGVVLVSAAALGVSVPASADMARGKSAAPDAVAAVKLPAGTVKLTLQIYDPRTGGTRTRLLNGGLRDEALTLLRGLRGRPLARTPAYTGDAAIYCLTAGNNFRDVHYLLAGDLLLCGDDAYRLERQPSLSLFDDIFDWDDVSDTCSDAPGLTPLLAPNGIWDPALLRADGETYPDAPVRCVADDLGGRFDLTFLGGKTSVWLTRRPAALEVRLGESWYVVPDGFSGAVGGALHLPAGTQTSYSLWLGAPPAGEYRLILAYSDAAKGGTRGLMALPANREPAGLTALRLLLGRSNFSEQEAEAVALFGHYLLDHARDYTGESGNLWDSFSDAALEQRESGWALTLSHYAPSGLDLHSTLLCDGKTVVPDGGCRFADNEYGVLVWDGGAGTLAVICRGAPSGLPPTLVLFDLTECLPHLRQTSVSLSPGERLEVASAPAGPDGRLLLRSVDFGDLIAVDLASANGYRGWAQDAAGGAAGGQFFVQRGRAEGEPEKAAYTLWWTPQGLDSAVPLDENGRSAVSDAVRLCGPTAGGIFSVRQEDGQTVVRCDIYGYTARKVVLTREYTVDYAAGRAEAVTAS